MLIVAFVGPRVVADDGVDFFESKVRPLLVDHCYECHSAETGESAGQFLIDSAVGMRIGGLHGAALVPGDAENSLLIKVVAYDNPEMQMPPAGKLSDDAIEILRHWIASGAADPRQATSTVAATSPMDRDPKTHWAFVAPVHPDAPRGAIDGASSDRDVLDAWARRSAKSAGVDVIRQADDSDLVRRLHFDLTGLPPTAQQITEYQQSERPDRYMRLVDELLASPAFAERLGRLWLDVARYADTVGYDFGGKERRIKGSERYRDWVIAAVASDMPYDRMIEHQLAGDRTDPNNADGNLDAMGFLTLGRKFINGLDVTDDRIDVITRGLLGLTVTCARCHDHKFDPIPTTDYYSLFGVLASSRQPDDGASPLMMTDKAKVGDQPVLIRGQAGNNGPLAPRQFLTSLQKPNEPRFTDGSGRWELAQRIVARDNPLTARVMVNRLWGHLIGKPLVDSPSDFGFRTQRPAVPEVLDELASDFVEHFSIKRTVRRIVSTRIYRQSSATDAPTIAADPDNRWLARGNRRRLDFESLRDSLLYVAGSLDARLGGPPLEITLPTPTPRRTIYAMIDRQNLPALFRTFDFASPDTHSPQRYFTTVPQQALFLMNSPQVLDLARQTASAANVGIDNASMNERIESLFRRVLRRSPSDYETTMAIEFLKTPASPLGPSMDPRSMWSYGVARVDGDQSVTEFQPFTHFTGDRWQTSPTFPDTSPSGYAFLDRENGHSPRPSDLAVVRRLTSPVDAIVKVRGQVGHRDNDNGDGIQVGIWIGGKRKFFATEKGNQRPVGPITGRVKAGQTIDLAVSPGPSDTSDSFFLRMTVQLSGVSGEILETNTARDFMGPQSVTGDQPLNRWAQLAHVLMMSNEFAFVD
ncbi:Planctomycete cytochrome C [Rubripirellula tenax]|uniref:Planctomycete cytochrome C n=2 Tax=Rubripirellula tenax TaxID=2528015 RepID=A0A5C6FG53_9BACT|nr:Planctomycete cytochrome C [Rubripirellula tenax]